MRDARARKDISPAPGHANGIRNDYNSTEKPTGWGLLQQFRLYRPLISDADITQLSHTF